MIRLLLLAFFSTTIVLAVSPEVTFENSNFTINRPIDSTKEKTLYNYNRFRLTASIHQDNWFFTSIGDIENYLGKEIISSTPYLLNRRIEADTPFSTQTGLSNYGRGEYSGKLYRLYGGYVDAKHRISFGLQKISMGVGRIWNPSDLFNPKNSLSLEPDEVYGVFSLVYTYSINDLTQITKVIAEQKNHNFKYASSIKGYVEVVDLALNLISSDDSSMLGYEIEGEIFDTGFALRSEGGWFEDKILKEEFFQDIVGADYTFENSLSLTSEWLYSSKNFSKEQIVSTSLSMQNNLMRSKSYAGLVIGYEFDVLLYGNLLGITNTNDRSFYIAPSLRYSLDDDMTVQIASMLYDGKDGSEFGDIGQTYYVNFKVTF